MNVEKIMGDIRADLTAVKDGKIDPIRAYKDCKDIADIIKATMDEMFSAVLDECDKYDPRELAERGIQIRNGSKRWDYSGCYEWAKLNAEIKELEEELKHRASLPQSDLVDRRRVKSSKNRPTRLQNAPSYLSRQSQNWRNCQHQGGDSISRRP